jgi:hypothetical protein
MLVSCVVDQREVTHALAGMEKSRRGRRTNQTSELKYRFHGSVPYKRIVDLTIFLTNCYRKIEARLHGQPNQVTIG